MVPDITVQTVLYNTKFEDVLDCIDSICNAAKISGVTINILVGDSSPQEMNEKDITELKNVCRDSSFEFYYFFFNENLGFSKGHNFLAHQSKGEYILICNPDIIVFGNFFQEMLKPFLKYSDTGIVEARQLPLEHPKSFSLKTGETNWASGACMLVKRADYLSIDGFDDKTFWMYCEDVDFSWRMKELNKRIIYQPKAPVYHPKSLNDDGSWSPTNTEIHYSLLSSLLLANKWQNEQALNALIKACENGSQDQKKSLEDFFRIRKNIDLPKREDSKGVTTFLPNFLYAPHKY